MANAPIHSFKASGTIEPSRFISATVNDFTVVQSGTGQMPIGVSQQWAHDAPIPGHGTDAATDGEALSAYGNTQIGYLTCGTAISAADLLKPSSVGKALVAGAGDKYGAVALEDGAEDELIRVQVQLGELNA